MKRVLFKLLHSVRTQSSGVMKYFEMEEKRLKSFLKMEEQWGKERKEGKKVRKCPKSCHLNCVCGAFSKAEVSFIALKPHVISFSNETVEAGGIAEGRSSSGVMAST